MELNGESIVPGAKEGYLDVDRSFQDGERSTLLLAVVLTDTGDIGLPLELRLCFEPCVRLLACWA